MKIQKLQRKGAKAQRAAKAEWIYPLTQGTETVKNRFHPENFQKLLRAFAVRF
jgi:hypothetical protein